MIFPVTSSKSRPQFGRPEYYLRLQNIIGLSSIVGQWPLWEAAGASAVIDVSGHLPNATPSNVTFGVDGIGDGRTAASFNGTSSYINIYSSALAGNFNAPAGTLMAWAKVNAAATWADGTTRAVAQFAVDTSSNLLTIRKSSAANTIQCVYTAGGTVKSINVTTSNINWMHLAMTWDKPGNALNFYINAIRQTPATGLGIWVGSLTATRCNIGARVSSADFWSGSIAHVILCNRALSAAEIVDSYKV